MYGMCDHRLNILKRANYLHAFFTKIEENILVKTLHVPILRFFNQVKTFKFSQFSKQTELLLQNKTIVYKFKVQDI